MSYKEKVGLNDSFHSLSESSNKRGKWVFEIGLSCPPQLLLLLEGEDLPPPSLTAAHLPTPVSYTDVCLSHTFSIHILFDIDNCNVHPSVSSSYSSARVRLQLLQKLFLNKSESFIFKKSNLITRSFSHMCSWHTMHCNDLYLIACF